MLVFEAGVTFQSPFAEIRQGEIIEEKFEKFLLRELESKVVHAFTAVGCFTSAATAATTAIGTLDPIAFHEFLVAGVNDAATAA